MKHQVNKLVYTIILSCITFFFSCFNKKESKKENIICSEANETLFNFIRSVSTLDTSLFYSIVNTDSIADNLNRIQKLQKNQETIHFSSKNLHKLFFFNFGPLKILPDNLQKLRIKEFPIKSYAINLKEQEKNYFKANLSWTRTIESDTSKVLLSVRKINGNWQVVSVSFNSN